jgi:hypothetical protein
VQFRCLGGGVSLRYATVLPQKNLGRAGLRKTQSSLGCVTDGEAEEHISILAENVKVPFAVNRGKDAMSGA